MINHSVRYKDGCRYEIGTRTQKIEDAIAALFEFELGYGGFISQLDEKSVQTTTHILGCRDVTTFSFTEQKEKETLYELLAIWNAVNNVEGNIKSIEIDLVMKTYVKVEAGVLQLVRNCLQRDIDEGKTVRKEVLDELDKNTETIENSSTIVEIDGLYKTKCANTEFVSGKLFYSDVIKQVVVYKNGTNKPIVYSGYEYSNQEEFDTAADLVFLHRF